MQIDIEDLENIKIDADKIFLHAEGEKVLLKLLEIQKQIEDAIIAAKAKLEDTALKLDPNFKSIQADKIKVYYRTFGSKYHIDENKIDLAPKELYEMETKINYKIDSEAVDKWINEYKIMPNGIIELERKKILTISLKNKIE